MAEAKGGVALVAKAAGLKRESLYRALSRRGNPRLWRAPSRHEGGRTQTDRRAVELTPIAHHRAISRSGAPAMVDRECFTVAPFAGHYESVLDCGREVAAGDVVGYLHDFDHIDMPPWPAVAGVDGILIAQACAAPVLRGQHIVVVGRILD